MTIDITPEAVELLAHCCDGLGYRECAKTLRALSAALTASQAETAAAYEAALDAASGYIQRVYGDEWAFLSNPTDRERILAAIPKGKDHE